MRSFFAKPPVSISRPCGFHIAEREAHIDPGLSGGFDLREDVIAIERHDSLARTGFRFFTDLQSEL